VAIAHGNFTCLALIVAIAHGPQASEVSVGNGNDEGDASKGAVGNSNDKGEASKCAMGNGHR
jgi:hypothetical protein